MQLRGVRLTLREDSIRNHIAVATYGGTTQGAVRRSFSADTALSLLAGFKEAGHRCRQALWFAQRAAEQEKEGVVRQLQTSGAVKAGIAVATVSCLSSSAADSSHYAGLQDTVSSSIESCSRAVRSEDVLDQLTQRITGLQNLCFIEKRQSLPTSTLTFD